MDPRDPEHRAWLYPAGHAAQSDAIDPKDFAAGDLEIADKPTREDARNIG